MEADLIQQEDERYTVDGSGRMQNRNISGVTINNFNPPDFTEALFSRNMGIGIT